MQLVILIFDIAMVSALLLACLPVVWRLGGAALRGLTGLVRGRSGMED